MMSIVDDGTYIHVSSGYEPNCLYYFREGGHQEPIGIPFNFVKDYVE